MRLRVADKKFRWFPNRVIFNIVAAAKKAQVDYLAILDRRNLLGLPDSFKSLD
jgi:predicted metal-dependent phosphoesterase TrpH